VRMHFITRLALLLMAGFLVVATQVWTGTTLEWLFIVGGALMLAFAAADWSAADREQRALDGLIALLGAWSIVEAIIFDGSTLKWWSFGGAVALAALATAGLLIHEMSTERVVHELSVTPAQRTPVASS
jgi:hypothetical protein